jgi:hypothetical protein
VNQNPPYSTALIERVDITGLLGEGRTSREVDTDIPSLRRRVDAGFRHPVGVRVVEGLVELIVVDVDQCRLSPTIDAAAAESRWLRQHWHMLRGGSQSFAFAPGARSAWCSFGDHRRRRSAAAMDDDWSDPRAIAVHPR